MGIYVNVKGVTEALRELRKAEQECRDAAGEVMEKQAGVIAEDARNRCPVDSGALKESIRYRVDKKKLDGAVIAGGKKIRGRDTYYATFVEYGTRSIKKGEKTRTSKRKRHQVDRKAIAAQPFLYPAARAHEEETTEKLSNAMHDILKRRVEG